MGFPTVGDYPDSGIFRAKLTPATSVFGDLKHSEHNSLLESTLERLGRVGGDTAEELAQVTNMTRAEVAQGTMRGPFFSMSDAEKDIGALPGTCRAMHRFALRQGARADGSVKWRCCDNARSSGTNACLSTPESITCEQPSFPVLVGRLVAARCGNGFRPQMRHGTDDVKAAYRAMPCAHPETTVIAIWDTVAERVAYYTMDGHNFGLAAAVPSFNRYTQLVAAIARRLFAVATAAYFDDYDTCEPAFCGSTGKACLRALHEWLGMPLSTEKDIPMRVENPFLGVITDFQHFVATGDIVMRAKPSRVANIVAGLEESRARDWMRALEADEWA
jgi:hypothetical protein